MKRLLALAAVAALLIFGLSRGARVAAQGGITAILSIAQIWTALQTFNAGIATTTLTVGGLAGTVTIANGTAALGTSLITSGACASVVTISASGVATTDNIMADFNTDPTGVTGYAPTAGGILTIFKYPTANNVNFKVCNNSASSITPGAITLNWRVVR